MSKIKTNEPRKKIKYITEKTLNQSFIYYLIFCIRTTSLNKRMGSRGRGLRSSSKNIWANFFKDNSHRRFIPFLENQFEASLNWTIVPPSPICSLEEVSLYLQDKSKLSSRYIERAAQIQ